MNRLRMQGFIGLLVIFSSNTQGNQEMTSILLDDSLEVDEMRVFQDFMKGPTNYSNANIMWV